MGVKGTLEWLEGGGLFFKKRNREVTFLGSAKYLNHLRLCRRGNV